MRTLEQIKASVSQWQDTIDARIREVEAVHLKGRRVTVDYRIEPRWSCGSGITSGEGLARKVALEEIRSWLYAEEGAYGEEQQAQTQTEDRGLKGIVVAKWWPRGKACHRECLDLLTGARYMESRPNEKWCKHLRITDDEWSKRYREALHAGDRETLKALDENREIMTGKRAW